MSDDKDKSKSDKQISNILKSNTQTQNNNISSHINSLYNEESSKLIINIIPAKLNLQEKGEDPKNNDYIINIIPKTNYLYFNSNFNRNIFEPVKIDKINVLLSNQGEYKKDKDNFLDMDMCLWIEKNIKQEKNISFFSFENRLFKGNFLFGETNTFTNESFFYHSFNLIISLLENKYDTIVIDYFKIKDNKFLIDYRSLQFNFQVDFLDFLNYLNEEPNLSSDINESSTIILTFKFFKYVNSNDFSKTEREGSLVLNLSYILIPFYNNQQINSNESLQDEKDKNDKIMNDGWNKYYTLIHSILNLNVDYFYENVGIDGPLLYTILKNTSVFCYFFYIENQIGYQKMFDIHYIISKLKIGNIEIFLNELENYINIDNFYIENYYSKLDFYLLDQIVSKIIKL